MLIFLVLFPIALCYTITYPNTLFIEKGKRTYFEIDLKTASTDTGGSYQIRLEIPSCIKLLGEETIDLGYISPSEERKIYVGVENNCNSLQKIKIKVDGPHDKNLEMIVVPFREPEIHVSREKLLYGVQNEVLLSINFTGEKICIEGDFIGENRLCSKNGVFKIKMLGDKEGTKKLNLKIEIYKNGFKYELNRTLTFIVYDEAPKVDLKTLYLSEKGELKFDLCENCKICIFSENLLLDRICSENVFYYEYLGDEGKVAMKYVLLKEVFGNWVPIKNGTIIVRVYGGEDLEILAGGVEEGKMRIYIVNPNYREIRDVFIKAGNFERYFSSIAPHDYESLEIPEGCYDIIVKFDGKIKTKEVCPRERKYNILIYLLILLVIPIFFLLKKVIKF